MFALRQSFYRRFRVDLALCPLERYHETWYFVVNFAFGAITLPGSFDFIIRRPYYVKPLLSVLSPLQLLLHARLMFLRNPKSSLDNNGN